MQRIKFTPNPAEYRQSSSVSMKKTVGHSGGGGSAGTPTKQRKIYEVWPGNVPQRFKQPHIGRDNENGGRMSYSHPTEQTPSNISVPHQKQRGASGSVSFQPRYQPGPGLPKMYLQPNTHCPTYPPEYWWGGERMGYSPTPDFTPNPYGYKQDVPQMFRDYPPIFPDCHVPQRPMYSFHPTQQEGFKRTITVPPSIKQPQTQASTSRNCEIKKPNTDEKATTSRMKVDEKSVEKRKPKKIFVSANIRGLQAWTELKHEMEIVFEIIGVLNSQVTTSKGIRCKSFLLKDGQGHTVTCEFFETDRQLGRVCRGKTYRCVGTFSVRRNIFHAVSVREAADKDVRIYRKLIAISNGTLKNYRDNNAK